MIRPSFCSDLGGDPGRPVGAAAATTGTKRPKTRPASRASSSASRPRGGTRPALRSSSRTPISTGWRAPNTSATTPDAGVHGRSTGWPSTACSRARVPSRDTLHRTARSPKPVSMARVRTSAASPRLARSPTVSSPSARRGSARHVASPEAVSTSGGGGEGAAGRDDASSFGVTGSIGFDAKFGRPTAIPALAPSPAESGHELATIGIVCPPSGGRGSKLATVTGGTPAVEGSVMAAFRSELKCGPGVNTPSTTKSNSTTTRSA